jgi:predicted nucleic acid-binding protein
MIYIDSSALLKRYVLEPDSALATTLMERDPDWVTARHTLVEVRRNLCRLLPAVAARTVALVAFDADWRRMAVVELDGVTCESASSIAMSTGLRTLDALHLAAALRIGGHGFGFLTFDYRLAHAAESLGLSLPVLPGARR